MISLILILIIGTLFVIYCNIQIEHYKNEQKRHETKPTHFPNIANKSIDLSSDVTIKPTCKDEFCYYDLDEIMKEKKADDPQGTYKIHPNHNIQYRITGGNHPILFNNGFIMDINIKDDTISYRLHPIQK